MTALPEGFDDLERFAEWALATEAERHAKRYATSMDEIEDFYSTAQARLPAIREHLAQFTVEELPPPSRQLFLIGLSLMEITPAVLFFGRQRAVEGFDAAQMVPIEG